jgi:peptidoglycan/LPS O-acetylase OafA/YrhL
LWSIIEIVIVCFIVAYVVFAGRSLSSIFAPIVFAIAIYFFIFEKGLVSRLLLSNLLTGIGNLSYSIYMMHALVFVVGFELFSFVHRQLGIEMFREIAGTRYIGSNPLEAGIVYIVMMLLTVACSRLTYLAIEEPGRAYFRRFVKVAPNA